MAGNKCECNCKMMLVGVAIACLVIGGIAGYWYSGQSIRDYTIKAVTVGCVEGCASNADPGACTQACYDSIKGGDYLPKQYSWDLTTCCAEGHATCCYSQQGGGKASVSSAMR